MADNQLILEIVLDDGSVQRGFASVKKEGAKTANDLNKSFSGFGTGLESKVKQIGAAIAAAFTVNTIKNFFVDSARAAAEAERATNALSVSLAQIGKFTPEAVNSFSEYAAELQRTTGIEDDLIKQNAALLVSLGGLSGQGLNTATKAALDLSQALQIDVGTAFNLVGKASAGSTELLGRYGIRLDESIPKNERFAALLDLIQKRFGGLAETRLNTFEGALQNLGNAFGEIRESVGGFITQSPIFRAVINELSKFLFELSTSIGSIATRGDIFGGLIKGALNFAVIINDFVIRPIELFFNLIKTGTLTVKLAFDGLVVAVVKVASSILNGFRDTFLGIAQIAGTFNEDLGNRLQSGILSISEKFTVPLEGELNKTKEIFGNTFESLSESANTAFDTNIADSTGKLTQRLIEAANAAKAGSANIKNAIVPALKEIDDEFKKRSDSINKTFSQQLVQGISRGAQFIGESLARGTFSFKDFSNTVLSIIGDTAIQLGNLLIAAGIGVNSLAQSLASFNGAAAIAAGAALVVIGSAIKSLSTSSSAAAAGIPGAIGSAPTTSDPVELEPTTQEQLQQREANQQITVQIQGNVFDSDETGLRIVDILNKEFDKGGSVIRSGALA